VTRAICASRPGAVLGVRGPFGSEWPVEDATDAELVVVAGGIGLAPLRLAVERGLVGARAVTVLYGARTPGDLLYQRELERWAARSGLRLDVTVDTAEGGWRGKVGVVPKLVAGARLDPGATVALVCGPEVMMRFAAVALLERGVPADRIYVSLERNMRCAVAHCGHCQLGPTMICRDGAVYRYDRIERLLAVREL
jgi:NAD(P)H-flavin reductase